MRTQLKSIAWVLITLLLFQSCYTQQVSVKQTIGVEKKVRIKTDDGKRYCFRGLIRKNGTLYGVKKDRGVGLVEKDLSHLNITEVKYYDPGATSTLAIVSTFGIIILIGALTVLSEGMTTAPSMIIQP